MQTETLLYNQWDLEEMKRETKKTPNKWRREHNISKPMECCKSSFNREVYGNEYIY